MSPIRGVARLQMMSNRSSAAVSAPLAHYVGVDVTDVLPSRRLLVVAPHPDDEVLACGATLARATDQGSEVLLAMTTNGVYGDYSCSYDEVAAMRRGELFGASGALGLSRAEVTCLGFDDLTLIEREDDLVLSLTRLVDEFEPEVVLAPSAWDLHGDHAALGRAARRVLGPRAIDHLEFAVWAWLRPPTVVAGLLRKGVTGHGFGLPAGRPRLVRTDGYLSRKIDALNSYVSQFAPSTVSLGLAPGGQGVLDDRFVRHFLRPEEVFFPAPRWQ